MTVQVGQCGNQIGLRFWELAVKEHASLGDGNRFLPSMSTFFRHVDSRTGEELSSEGVPISRLKARAVLIDMEEGVVNSSLKSAVGELFDPATILTDVSGAGNNFAHGFSYYGEKYGEQISDRVRKAVETCDSPQSFFCAFSLGGGTGSGLGAFSLGVLDDLFPDIARVVCPVLPSLNGESDVVTAPYNSALSLAEIHAHSSCVFPVTNDALASLSESLAKADAKGGSGGIGGGRKASFDRMNAVVARFWLDLTSSMRFDGSLNVDLSDITTNMIPYPDCKYIIPGLAPVTLASADLRLQPRNFDQLFTDVLSPAAQLVAGVDLRSPSTSLAHAFLVRGSASISEVTRNVERVRSSLSRPSYLHDAFKLGLCGAPPLGSTQSASVLGLGNSSCVSEMFTSVSSHFDRLFRRKAHMHHYLEYIEEDAFRSARASLSSIVEAYSEPPRKTTSSSWASRALEFKPLIAA